MPIDPRPEIELGALARLLRQVQKMDVLGQLASGVAHESSNSLTAIVGFGHLIETDPRLPEDMRRDAGLLTREADRTRRMIGDLLDLARQRPPERYPAAVAMLLRSALDLQAYALAAAHVTVSLVIPDDLPTVDVDRAQMQQVLLGLILNAIDAIAATGRPGRIVIGAEVARPSAGPDAAGPDAASERIRISVSDDGPGVPAGALDRIFSPFFTTKEPGKGTGLGLSVSRQIVDDHGGRLWHEAGPDGHGATFVIELPLRAGVPRRRRARPSRASATDPEARSVRGLAVLVVDDEGAIRQLLARILRDAQVVTAATGVEALERVRERPFHVILVDLRMAEMTGTAFYAAAAALRPELATRAIFMSGDVLDPELLAFAEAHRIGRLPKPFGQAEVLGIVADVAEREARRGERPRPRGRGSRRRQPG